MWSCTPLPSASKEELAIGQAHPQVYKGSYADFTEQSTLFKRVDGTRHKKGMLQDFTCQSKL